MIPRQPRSTPAVAVSIILHVVVGVVLVRVLTVPSVLIELFSERGQPVVVERIGFIALPRAPQGGAPRAARAGGDDRPDRGRPAETPTLVAPTAVPSAVPAAPAAPVAAPEGGTGERIGEGGPTRGIRPSYTDPRLWIPSGPVVAAPMRVPQTRADSLHDLLAEKIRVLNDSLAALPPARAPGDWTWTDSKGRKYGVDQQFIRLGKFSIPTAVLALLPLNVQANPIQLERQRTMNEMTRQIQEQAARAARDDDFRAAVKALRERKDRERREAAEKAKGEAPPAPVKP
ncbi:MAG: hypothetical protein FJ363_09920 [Gemmatimonadetes bacterium]|nr:hypothetical protein [Gemmatimonadota bacterium]